MTTDLWDWAVAAYASPEVQALCLDLQDTGKQSVPLMLWAAWAAASGRAVDAETVEAACDTARVWDDTAVAPLRAIRRALKGRLLDMEDADREAVRSQVKAIELEAERRLLNQLAGLTPQQAGPPRPIFEALIAVARQWDRSVPRADLQSLSERLSA